LLHRLSLRARLLLGVLALATVGLVAADIATYKALHSFLLRRTDRTLNAAHFALEQNSDLGTLAAAAPGVYVAVLSPGGSVLQDAGPLEFPPRRARSSPPRLPASIDLPENGGGPEYARYFTVAAQDGESHYRVRASGRGLGNVLVVAVSLHDVDGTLHRLLFIELVTTLAVLAAIGGIGLWVVRLGLRPLDEIEETAAAIGAGDLSRRVERADSRTEVGRLGLALNAMLGQIETAFKAREASESRLRRFVADASHELRTPLSAVRAYAELFKRGAAQRPDDLARSMEGISRESERMSALVEDLLLLARLDEGRPLECEPVELDQVVSEAVETARAVDPERKLAVELEPVRVLGDRDRLREVVDNLLANVRSHTPAEAPASVALRRVDGNAELAVADSGPGMTPEEAERVFERFYRADPSRARASGGVGLGLAIVAAVAAAHGGSVEASAEPGTGSTFRVSLPLAND